MLRTVTVFHKELVDVLVHEPTKCEYFNSQ